MTQFPWQDATGGSRQRGVGFVEILVAIVILSIGVLAGARMQIFGMRYSQSAYYQSQASFMASDIIDRMRANIDGVQAGHYNSFSAAAGLTDPGCGTRTCTPAELASQDRYDWSGYLFPASGTDGLAALLPGNATNPASATVSRKDDGEFSAVISWVEDIDGEAVVVPLQVDFVTEF